MVEYSKQKNNIFLTVKNLFYSALMQSELGQRAALNGQLAYRKRTPTPSSVPYPTRAFTPYSAGQPQVGQLDKLSPRHNGLDYAPIKHPKAHSEQQQQQSPPIGN